MLCINAGCMVAGLAKVERRLNALSKQCFMGLELVAQIMSKLRNTPQGVNRLRKKVRGEYESGKARISRGYKAPPGFATFMALAQACALVTKRSSK